jgi:hypothetical protein
MGSGPIFIGGLSFSGKTQLRMMLCAHPNIVITRRTYMWREFYNRFGDLSRPENFERCLGAMLAYKHTLVLEPDPERIRREYWQGTPTYARLFGLFHQHYAEKMGKPRWGDQLGFVEKYIDLIFAAYPDARMIHMVRDPRERIGESLARRIRRMGWLGWELAQWRHSAQLAHRNERQYADRYLVVHCEELFSDAEKVLRAVCLFLDEAFIPKMLEGVDLKETQTQLTAPEQKFIQSRAAREMSFLGYQHSRQLLAGVAMKYLLVDYPVNMAGMLLWDLLGNRQREQSQ